MKIEQPQSVEAITSFVHTAVGEQTPFTIAGHGSKRTLVKSPEVAMSLDMTGHTGIELYEPEELVLKARAGTPLAEIQEALTQHNQQLAFEPVDCGHLCDKPRGEGTFGGMIMSGLSGARRLKAGAVRDHVLGVELVTGRAEFVKSGGRVVKNVTGYDLSKLVTGSWGRLGVLTSAVVKVLPAAEAQTTLALDGLSDEQATRLMAAALGSEGEVSSAAHLPELEARSVGFDSAITLLRIEGIAVSVDARIAALSELAKPFGTAHMFGKTESVSLWQAISDGTLFASDAHKPLWRVSMAPGQGYKMVDTLRRQAPARVYYDWQGGLIWLQMDGAAEFDCLQRVVAQFGGGHGRLMRGQSDDQAERRSFQAPQSSALGALEARLLEAFDPLGLVNPGVA